MKLLQSAAAFEENTKFIAFDLDKTAEGLGFDEENTNETKEELSSFLEKMNQHGKKEKEKERKCRRSIDKKCNELKIIFGIKDIKVVPGDAYDLSRDYKEIEESIPKIYRVLIKIKEKNPRAIKALSSVRIIINGDNSMVGLFRDTLDYFDEEAQNNIWINIEKNEKGITEDLINDLRGMGHKI